VRGKRIVEFAPDPDTGEIGGHPHDLVEYTGTGKATAVGLAAGPDGLYFTELYPDQDFASPISPGARLFRVSYTGGPGERQPVGVPWGDHSTTSSLEAAKRHCKKKFRGKKRAKCIKRAKAKARAL
jgi:hypothetical protein